MPKPLTFIALPAEISDDAALILARVSEPLRLAQHQEALAVGHALYATLRDQIARDQKAKGVTYYGTYHRRVRRQRCA